MSEQHVSITPLLKTLAADHDIISRKSLASEVASALALIFEDRLAPVQTASLLTCLRIKGLDEDSQVIAACAQIMRGAAAPADEEKLRKALSSRARPMGSYRGGLCDIVGTGGDGHSTFNVSTASSIIASALLTIAKHGAQASSSKSGSADVLMALKPRGPDIDAVTAENVWKVFEHSNYAFLFAKRFHPGMRHVAPVRKDLGFRTIFNILGPLANPLYRMMEAGVYGVYKKELGPVYANALRMCGSKKAMVVCGEEELDEISCAGRTSCWRLVTDQAQAGTADAVQISIEGREYSDEMDRRVTSIHEFELHPSDFGLPVHSLEDVLPGRGPEENAELLMKLLRNELPPDDPTLHFVLLNTAALLVVSGICDSHETKTDPEDRGEVVNETGPGGGRWKEGVRRARWAIESGRALQSINDFIQRSHELK